MYENLQNKELLHYVYQDRLKNIFHFKIVNQADQFEPQMLVLTQYYTKAFWTPLDSDGYWAEPKSFFTGSLNNRYWTDKKTAELSILRARRINNQHYLRLIEKETGKENALDD